MTISHIGVLTMAHLDRGAISILGWLDKHRCIPPFHPSEQQSIFTVVYGHDSTKLPVGTYVFGGRNEYCRLMLSRKMTEGQQE